MEQRQKMARERDEEEQKALKAVVEANSRKQVAMASPMVSTASPIKFVSAANNPDLGHMKNQI